MGPESLAADQELLFPFATGVIDEDGVVVPGGGIHDGTGEFGEVGVAELGHGPGDDAGAPLAQTARRELGR
jgi:hypothetical protein